MSESTHHVPDATSRFFGNHLKCLDDNNIPVKQRRWYVKHIETFIKARNGQKIKTPTSQDITQYLKMIGRQKSPFWLAISAMYFSNQNTLFELLKAQVCRDVDWGFGIDSARQLKLEHPTTAKV